MKDGYGNSFDRSDVCKAGSASVVVRTVDNCELLLSAMWGRMWLKSVVPDGLVGPFG